MDLMVPPLPRRLAPDPYDTWLQTADVGGNQGTRMAHGTEAPVGAWRPRQGRREFQAADYQSASSQGIIGCPRRTGSMKIIPTEGSPMPASS